MKTLIEKNKELSGQSNVLFLIHTDGGMRYGVRNTVDREYREEELDIEIPPAVAEEIRKISVPSEEGKMCIVQDESTVSEALSDFIAACWREVRYQDSHIF